MTTIRAMLARLRTKNSVKIQKLSNSILFILIAIILSNWSSSFLVDSFFFPSSISKIKNVSYSRSAMNLQNLVSADIQVVKILNDNVKKLSNKPYLRRSSEIYMADMLRGSGMISYGNNTEEEVQKITKNPIATYRTIRRMVTLLPDLFHHANGIIELPDGKVSTYLHKGMPDRRDLNQAMNGLLRLHMIYNFNIAQISDGNISGVLTKAKLDAVHCYEIGLYGMNSGSYFAHAVDWLELSLNKITVYKDLSIDKGIVTLAFTNAINKHDEEYSKSSGLEPYFFEQKVTSMMENGDFAQRKTRRNIKHKKSYAHKKGKIEKELNFWSLCRGDNHQTLIEKSELFCWLESKAHEQFLIGPMKMEFLARNPDLVQIYDVLSEKIMKEIPIETTKRMTSSFVVQPASLNKNETNTVEVEMDARTSESTWLNETTRKEYVQLVHTISHLTGLKAFSGTGSEYFQVASYTSSGHYDAHLDSSLPEIYRKGNGDRIATFLIYLTDVETGGQTAFPRIGVAAKPIKGSAIFWYNIFRSEQADLLTLHGACPVLIGHKFVANKWIRFYDQFLTHKCSKDSQERFHVAVNKKYVPISKDSQLLASKRSNFHKWECDTTLKLSKYSYRSPLGLKYLVETEQSIYKIMKYSYEQVSKNISVDMKIDPRFMKNHQLVQNYLKDFEDSTGKLLSEVLDMSNENWRRLSPSTTISWNPIAAYRMIWRVEHILKKWIFDHDLIWGTSYQKSAKAVKQLYKYSDGPNAGDLKDARTALMNMQYVYNLNATDMAFGVVDDKPLSLRLSALQCYEIGMEGVSDGSYTVGIDWLEAALLLVKSKTDSSISLVKVEKALNEAKDVHDKHHMISEGWEPVFFYDKFSSSKDHQSFRRLTRKAVLYNKFHFKEEPNYAEINYNGICSGWSHQTQEEKSKLFCWYEHKIHPFWKLNPLKAEIHSLRPKLEIVQYYDLLSEKVINTLKELAEPKFTKITTNSDGHSFGSGITEEIIKKPSPVDSWLSESENENVLHVSKLIERITGLTVANKSHDDLQISAYSPGASNGVHMDVPLRIPKGRSNGGRIASFTFHLSDVHLGGFTAFAQAGVKIVPTRGSGVFWYNLYSSGHPNLRTYHGVCPLVFGENWIARKWISYEKQNTHKCHLIKLTPDEILVNGKTKYY